MEIIPDYCLAFFQGIGPSELLIIFLVLLLLFGGKKLPELARGLGKSLREFKKATHEIEDDFRSTINQAETPLDSEKSEKPITDKDKKDKAVG